MPWHDETDLYEKLLDRLFDGVLILDRDAVIVVWNEAAERITGLRAADLIGHGYLASPIQHADEEAVDSLAVRHLVLETLEDGVAREGRAYFKHVEGFRLPVAVRTIPVQNRDGQISAAAAIFSDNKSIIAALQNVQTSSETVLFDALTGIGNRPHIEVKIRSALQSYLAGGIPFGLLFMDIDHFKNFNDTYGHLTGDKILRYVANTIRNNLRLSDSCGRWGGEEFIAVLLDVDAEGMSRVAEKLRLLVSQTQVSENDHGLSVTISIGATLVRGSDSLQSLIGRVDKLMYQSKQAGRNRVTVGA